MSEYVCVYIAQKGQCNKIFKLIHHGMGQQYANLEIRFIVFLLTFYIPVKICYWLLTQIG